jgi:hypothetical protein
MSHEIFELFGMLGAGAGLTALIHRAVQPVLLRLAASAADPMPASRLERQPGAGFASAAEPLGSASPRRLGSAT